jgi:Leucine-rich repeat (LRR) protein
MEGDTLSLSGQGIQDLSFIFELIESSAPNLKVLDLSNNSLT